MSDIIQLISDFSDSLPLTEKQLIDKLDISAPWETRYRNLMLLGKSLTNFPQQLKTPENLVKGCESQVWLHIAWHQDKLKLAASSDAKIVKGLLVVVMVALTNKTRDEIKSFDFDSYFEQLALIHHLSPSRANGIKAVIEEIKASSPIS